MTDRRPVVLVVGSVNVDLVAFADRIPAAGETLAGSAFLQGFGGKGANQAVMAARFDVDLAMVGAVGDDPNGAAALDNFRRNGVRVDDLATAATTTGVASIWVDGSGSNRIVIVAGANASIEPAAAAAAVERTRPAVVVGQFEIPQAVTTAAFEAARRLGAVTILNPAPAQRIEPALLAVTDWLIPNETELAQIGGPTLAGADQADAGAIRAYAVALGTGLVVTVGAHGCVLADRESAIAIPAPPVRAVDTTGAGDAFVGAFAGGLALGLDPERAARLGVGVSADSVTRPGTQASYPDRAVATAMLATIRAS